MSKKSYRIAVVGATSLLGREVAEELASGALAAADVVLLDNEQESGKLDVIAGEATFVQRVEPASFEGADVAIFTTRADAEKHLKTARSLEAAVVDLTGTLVDATVRAPQLTDAASSFGRGGLTLETTAVAAAHPVTTMLVAALQRAGKLAQVRSAFATVLQPASENGAAALDELHQQTVNLLSFQPVPKEQFDAQAAFNLLPRFGDDAKAELSRAQQLVQTQLRALLAKDTVVPFTQWVQAPVFHGFAVSLFLEFSEAVDQKELETALDGDLVEIVARDEEPVSNLSVAGQARIQVEVQSNGNTAESDTYALWMVVDNLKLAAQTAVASALELTRLRPLGKVQ